MQNKELWNSVFVTNPASVTAIVGKQYKGNSPKPYFIIERATDTFGPCGIGWGVKVENERFERLTDSEVLHVALVTVWYIYKDKRGEVQQIGQTRAAYLTSTGKSMVDEDAPKKSVTDGMVKCLSMLGFAGDIFSGRWDDSKYVEYAADVYARQSLPTINDDEFAKLMDKWWFHVIEKGRTAKDIIANVSKKALLTEDQILKIEALVKTANEQKAEPQ